MAEAAVKDRNTVVFLRHGESEWIHKNIYCGWYDSDITREGEREAEKAGQILKKNGYIFDEAYTSVLKRAGKTVDILIKVLEQPDIPVYKTWRLNSRHYGALTGLSKGESIRKYGEDQIKLLRRSYDIPPPEITKDNPYYNIILEDPIYKGGPSEEEFPTNESLQQAIERTLLYWNDIIAPRVANGRRILIIGHMNSLRAIVKSIDRISDEKIMEYNIPTGVPFIYELTTDMKPIISLKFLGDEDYVKRANEILTTPGRGFERPKRSKPSVLEVYDYLSKKAEHLAAVQNVTEKSVVEQNAISEFSAHKVDEKLETRIDELVETKLDERVESEVDKIVEPRVNEIIKSKVDEIEQTVKSKEEEIIEPSETETRHPTRNMQLLTKQSKNETVTFYEKTEKPSEIEMSISETNDKTDDDLIIPVIDEANKTERMPEIESSISDIKEQTVNNIYMKEDVISGEISVLSAKPERIEDDSKPVGTSVSTASSNAKSEIHELISKESGLEAEYKNIEEKISMATSRLTTSRQTAVPIKEQEKNDIKSQQEIPKKTKESVEIENKSRTLL